MKRFSKFLTAFVSGVVALSALSGSTFGISEAVVSKDDCIESEIGNKDLLDRNTLAYYDADGEIIEGSSLDTTTDIPITTTSVEFTENTDTFTTTEPVYTDVTGTETVTETTTAAPVVMITTTTITTTAPSTTTTLRTYTTEPNANGYSFKVFNIYEAHKQYMFELTSTTATIATTRVTTTTRTVTNPPLATQINVDKGIKGIDVSQWQGSINWNNVKSDGVKFAIIRAGYGRYTSQKDNMFDANMKNTEKAGLSRGIYWYSYATSAEDARLEAEACYQIIKNYKFEYPIYYDIEDDCQKGLSAATISAMADTFCSYFQNKGYYAGIYSYANFINTKFYNNILEKYDVWVAHYNVNYPAVSAKYGMWQYTNSGLVNGISGFVDFDYAYKDYPYIISKNHKNGY